MQIHFSPDFPTLNLQQEFQFFCLQYLFSTHQFFKKLLAPKHAEMCSLLQLLGQDQSCLVAALHFCKHVCQRHCMHCYKNIHIYFSTIFSLCGPACYPRNLHLTKRLRLNPNRLIIPSFPMRIVQNPYRFKSDLQGVKINLIKGTLLRDFRPLFFSLWAPFEHSKPFREF